MSASSFIDTRSARLLRAAAALSALAANTACSAQQLFDEASAFGDVSTLYVDVSPTSALYPDLMPQSFELSEYGLDQQFSLATPIALDANSGDLGASAGGFDGVLVARSAEIEHRLEVKNSSIQGALLPGDDYTLAWLPEDLAAWPLAVIEGQSVSGDAALTPPAVDAGWLQVAVDGGAELALIESGSGIRALESSLDGGWYGLWLAPGDYEVEIVDDAGRRWGWTTAITEGVQEIEQALPYGNLISGQVFGPEGALVAGAAVTATALTLEGFVGTSLVASTTSDADGGFLLALPPGEYMIDYAPPLEAGLSPVGIVATFDGVDTASISLPARETVEGVLLDPDGAPAAGVWISAREVDFEGHIFETVSGADGSFSLEVSDVDLAWTLTPPDEMEAAVTHLLASPSESSSLQLVEGREVSGCVDFEGAVIAWAPITIRGGETSYADTVTDADGCFSVRIDG